MEKIISLERNCPICNSKNGYYMDEITGAMEDGNCLPDHYNIVCCADCGFAFADMLATQADFDKYYTYLNNYSEAEGLRTNQAGHLDSYNFINELIVGGGIEKAAKIIDIGCGGGELLCFLKEKGYENLYGLDPSKESVRLLKNRGIGGMVGSVFEKIPTDYEGAFDLVISTMVIEHIYDLNMYVQQLKKFLKADGHLLINAPSVEGFAEFICPKPNYFNQEHINYFSEQSLENLFGKHGITRCNRTLFFAQGKEKQLYFLGKFDGNKYSLYNDTISRKSIEVYLKQWKAIEEQQTEKIKRIVSLNKKVVVFGCGQYTKQLLAKHPELVERIKYFCDNNTMKQGICIFNRKICDLDTLLDDSEDVIVCICSMLNGQDILRQLKSKKINKEMIIL